MLLITIKVSEDIFREMWRDGHKFLQSLKVITMVQTYILALLTVDMIMFAKISCPKPGLIPKQCIFSKYVNLHMHLTCLKHVIHDLEHARETHVKCLDDNACFLRVVRNKHFQCIL